MFEFSSAVNVKQCIYFSKQTIGRAIMCADTAVRMEISPLKARKRIKQLSFFNPAVSEAHYTVRKISCSHSTDSFPL